READRVARAERERTAVADERLRIAREVHDVLAHSLSAITVQAGVGLHLLDRDPDQARSALAAIRTTSAEALDEVRAVLGVVRGDGGNGAPLAPTWDLAALPRLVRQAAAGAVAATPDVGAAAAALPGRRAGGAYRVGQESLTNVRRGALEAPRAEGGVRGRRGRGGTVTVAVTDDGAGASSGAEPGYGLRGMRERVESVSGTLDAGPVPDAAGSGRGFRVRAVFPWPGTTPAPGTTGRPEEAPRRAGEAP